MTCSCVMISALLHVEDVFERRNQGGNGGECVCEGIDAGWVTQYV